MGAIFGSTRSQRVTRVIRRVRVLVREEGRRVRACETTPDDQHPPADDQAIAEDLPEADDRRAVEGDVVRRRTLPLTCGDHDRVRVGCAKALGSHPAPEVDVDLEALELVPVVGHELLELVLLVGYARGVQRLTPDLVALLPQLDGVAALSKRRRGLEPCEAGADDDNSTSRPGSRPGVLPLSGRGRVDGAENGVVGDRVAVAAKLAAHALVAGDAPAHLAGRPPLDLPR